VTVRKLESSPATLPLFVRAGLGAVPGSGKLPFLAGGGGAVPDLELELAGVEADVRRLAEYAHLCGFALRDALPATYPHVLAFPLHMSLLTDPSFPFPAIGLVHIANRIQQARPIGVKEPLTLRVRATQPERHPKGRAFRLLTEARVGDELVWSGESTNLRRGGGGEGAAAPRERASDAAEPRELRDEAEWSLPGDLGRRYAGVAGDRNPIHLYGVTAKAFGFPRQIAHGMWTKARCLAQLDSRVPEAFTVDVAFKRPILLPSKVRFASVEVDGETAFAVRAAREGTPHLEGSIAAG
jgi:acyl dehydratase